MRDAIDCRAKACGMPFVILRMTLTDRARRSALCAYG